MVLAKWSQFCPAVEQTTWMDPNGEILTICVYTYNYIYIYIYVHVYHLVWKTMENHGKPWKTMENHGKPWNITIFNG